MIEITVIMIHLVIWSLSLLTSFQITSIPTNRVMIARGTKLEMKVLNMYSEEAKPLRLRSLKKQSKERIDSVACDTSLAGLKAS